MAQSINLDNGGDWGLLSGLVSLHMKGALLGELLALGVS